MIRSQDLFIDATNIKSRSKADRKNILISAASTRECLVDGFKAIGNLMFWACDNETYPEDEMRADMANVGLLLNRGSEIIEATIEVGDIADFYLEK